MFLLIANLLLLAGALGVALLVHRQLQLTQHAQHESRRTLALCRLLAARLEVAKVEMEQAWANHNWGEPGGSNLSQSTLECFAALADPSALADQRALEQAVARVVALPAGEFADLFAADQRCLAIARLHDAGECPSEIARRLNLPIGEVELLLGLRSC